MPDSTMGKMMEKAGGLLKNEKLEQKGAEKREQAGGLGGSEGQYGTEAQGGYGGGSNNNY